MLEQTDAICVFLKRSAGHNHTPRCACHAKFQDPDKKPQEAQSLMSCPLTPYSRISISIRYNTPYHCALHNPIHYDSLAMNFEPSETSIHDELCDARREIALLRDQAAFFTEDHNKQVAQLESNFADQLSRANRLYDSTFDRFQRDIDLLRAQRDRVESDRADSASEEVKELQEAVHRLMREKERSEEKLAELEYSYTVASQGGKSRQEDLGRIQELQREKRELVTMVETLRKERGHELQDADGKRGMDPVRATNQELRVENERLVRERGNMAASLADLRETNRRLMAERAYLATDREDVWAENALVVKERVKIC